MQHDSPNDRDCAGQLPKIATALTMTLWLSAAALAQPGNPAQFYIGEPGSGDPNDPANRPTNVTCSGADPYEFASLEFAVTALDPTGPPVSFSLQWCFYPIRSGYCSPRFSGTTPATFVADLCGKDHHDVLQLYVWTEDPDTPVLMEATQMRANECFDNPSCQGSGEVRTDLPAQTCQACYPWEQAQVSVANDSSTDSLNFGYHWVVDASRFGGEPAVSIPVSGSQPFTDPTVPRGADLQAFVVENPSHLQFTTTVDEDFCQSFPPTIAPSPAGGTCYLTIPSTVFPGSGQAEVASARVEETGGAPWGPYQEVRFKARWETAGPAPGSGQMLPACSQSYGKCVDHSFSTRQQPGGPNPPFGVDVDILVFPFSESDCRAGGTADIVSLCVFDVVKCLDEPGDDHPEICVPVEPGMLQGAIESRAGDCPLDHGWDPAECVTR